jgi:hypothetical protein
VANAGEAVVIHASLSCSGVPTNGAVGVRTSYQETPSGGSPTDFDIPWTHIATNGSSSPAYQDASSNGLVSLNAGSSYLFQALVYMTAASGTCFCNLIAEVVSQ